MRAGSLPSYFLVATIINRADIIAVNLRNSIGDDLTLFEHTRAVRLNYGSAAIDVDNETGKTIALAVNQTIDCSVCIVCKAQQFSQAIGIADFFYPEIGAAIEPVERKNAHRNRTF